MNTLWNFLFLRDSRWTGEYPRGGKAGVRSYCAGRRQQCSPSAWVGTYGEAEPQGGSLEAVGAGRLSFLQQGICDLEVLEVLAVHRPFEH